METSTYLAAYTAGYIGTYAGSCGTDDYSDAEIKQIADFSAAIYREAINYSILLATPNILVPSATAVNNQNITIARITENAIHYAKVATNTVNRAISTNAASHAMAVAGIAARMSEDNMRFDVESGASSLDYIAQTPMISVAAVTKSNTMMGKSYMLNFARTVAAAGHAVAASACTTRFTYSDTSAIEMDEWNDLFTTATTKNDLLDECTASLHKKINDFNLFMNDLYDRSTRSPSSSSKDISTVLNKVDSVENLIHAATEGYLSTDNEDISRALALGAATAIPTD